MMFAKFTKSHIHCILQQRGLSLRIFRVPLTWVPRKRLCATRCCKMQCLSLIGFLFVLTACGAGSKPPFEYIGPNMVKGPEIKAQRADFKSPNNGDRGMRVPPKGSIPVDYDPYLYNDDAEAAGKELRNPLRPTKALLLRGQQLFNTYCAVCHGETGDGAGYIVPKFPQPPSLFSEKVNNWSDGRIFHVITRGQNLMPSYASQVSAEERWAIISYMRVLQKAAHPTAADLKAVGK